MTTKIIETIMNSDSEGEIFKILEEQVIDIETPRSWGEEAEILEQNNEQDKAAILRAAEKRWLELERE